MKKLMIATAALCAAVGANALESANTVGYIEKATVANDNHYFVHTFAAVGGSVSAVPLSSIKPSATWDAVYNYDYLATVQADGSEAAIYSYYTAAQAASIPGCTNPVEGWYAWDIDTWEVGGECVSDTVTVPLNGGFLVYSAAGATLTLSGQVISGDTELKTVANDNAYTGNITPAALSLGDIVPDSSWDAVYNYDYLATVQADGSEAAIYSYYTAAQAASIPGCTNPVAGWYAWDVDTWEVGGECLNESVSFPAGTGFLVYSAAGATLTVPSPLN